MVYTWYVLHGIHTRIYGSGIMITKEDKIKFIIEQEKLANNSWKWIKNADEKTINELYEYWTQEENPNEKF